MTPAAAHGGGKAPRLLHDDHVHGGREFSGHSAAFPLSELLQAASCREVTVSLREHAPLPPAFVTAHPDAMKATPGMGTPVGLVLGPGNNVDGFLEEVAAAGIALGFEIDVLGPQWLEHSLQVVDGLSGRAREHGLGVDCFNASHHYPWDMTFSGMQAAIESCGGPARFLTSYFGSIRAYVRTGRFGAVSHLEALRKYDRTAAGGPPFASLMSLYREEVGATLEEMARQGTSLEYNTAGSRTWRRPYVSLETLRTARRLGVGIVVGSDAHDPSRVAAGFDLAAAELDVLGFREVVTFRCGKAVPVPLRAAAAE